MGNLARGTVIYGLGEVSSRLVTFVLLPVFTAYLSPADYGIISILGALTIFLTPVFSLGIGGGMAPSYFDGNNWERKRATVATSFVIVGAGAAVLAAVGLSAAAGISRILFGTADFAAFVRLACLASAFAILTTPLRQFLQFEERAKLYVLFSTTSVLASTALSVVFVVVLGRGVRGMLEATLLGQALTFVLFAAPCVSWLRPRVHRAIGRELLKLSVPLVPAFGCTFVLQHGSKYLLQWLGNLDDVGVYTVGINIGLVVSVIVSAFQSAWIPYFMSLSDKPEEAKVAFGRVLTYYLFAIGAVSLALFAAARPLIMVMTQPAFHDAWRVVGLSATAQLLAGVGTVLLPGMYIAKEVQFIGVLQGIAGVASIVMNLCLIPVLGVFGAGLALPLTYLVLAMLQYGWNRRRQYLDVSYEWTRVTKFAAIYVAFAAVALWNRELPLSSELPISVVLLASVPPIVYLQLTASERAAVRARARRLIRGIPNEQSATA